MKELELKVNTSTVVENVEITQTGFPKIEINPQRSTGEALLSLDKVSKLEACGNLCFRSHHV